MCEYVLRNQDGEYVKDVRLKHMKLPTLKIKNCCKSVAAISLRKILNEYISVADLKEAVFSFLLFH